MIRKYYTKFLTAGASYSPQIVVRSWLVGTFIAFSPFVGLHSIMALLSTWLLRLNIIIVFAVAYGINNPWTMIPIYLFEYAVGYGIVHKFFAIPLEKINPAWMLPVNEYVRHYIPIKGLSLWAFLIGGHIVSLVAVGISYVIIKRALRPHMDQS